MKKSMPWYSDIYFPCCDRIVDIDAHIEWFASGKLPEKYAKALKKFYNTDDAKEIMNKMFFNKSKVLLYCDKCNQVWIVDLNKDKAIKKVAMENDIINIAEELIKVAKEVEYSKDVVQNLIERGMDPYRRDVVIDKETTHATFLLYNLHGQLVGYQRYNPLGDKKHFYDEEDLVKYFTWVGNDNVKGKKLACWGLDSIKSSTKILYITEGIFDANMIQKTGRACVALLTGTPSPQMIEFLNLLPYKKIAICDNDEGGSKSHFKAFYTTTVPDPYKDTGEMPLNEVDEFLTKIEQGKIKVSSCKIAVNAEKEVERLLKVILKNSQYKNHVFSVGGYNRDQYMGLDAKDLDIVVDLKNGAENVSKFVYSLFTKQISQPRQMGKGYPIWQITFKDDITYQDSIYQTNGAVIEFAETMKESFPDENSRQRETEFGTLREDVDRRDFSVNSLLKDLSTGEFLDLTGQSMNDIDKGILQGNPGVDLNKIFKEDSLRMLRLVRFFCKYGWSIPKYVLKAVRSNAQRIEVVSAERIMAELTKVMKMGKLNKAIKLMKITGLLKYVFPEIQALIAVEQPKEFHMEGDCYKHTLEVLRNAPATIEGQLAALLHDVGKASTQEIIDNTIHFYGHEKVGGEMARAILHRLKFDTDTINKVVKIIENHMRPFTLVNAEDKAIRKFIREMGNELEDVIAQADADEKGSIPNKNEMQIVKDKIERVKNAPIKIESKPILNGNELMELFGITKKDVSKLPMIGKASKFLLDLQDEYASRNEVLTKEIAMDEVLKQFE